MEESNNTTTRRPRVEIEYCPKCRWLMRAAWIAQELLTTFEEEMGEVALIPSKIGGRFDIYLDGNLLYSRKQKGEFPEIKELKQTIRDIIAPQKSLGHSDKK